MEKKKRPVAMCTGCSKNSWSVEVVNQRCKNIINGKKCQGLFQSMLRSDDWKECGDCNATGTKNNELCVPCGGDGWIGIRIS